MAAETVSDTCSKRVRRDLKDFAKQPPWGIYISHDEENYLKVHCLLVGPDKTPYEKGFFYFVVTFPNDYPMSPPHVQFMTTSAGKVRFNPNLYKCGKVCLSILGTWPGPEWSPGHSLTSVLVSIQSLLCEKPYHNEPGYEEERNPGDSDKYNEVLRHETLRVAVCEMVLNKTHLAIPQCLIDLMQKKFLLWFEFYEDVGLQHYDMTGQILPRPFLLDISNKHVYEYDAIVEELNHIKHVLQQGQEA